MIVSPMFRSFSRLAILFNRAVVFSEQLLMAGNIALSQASSIEPLFGLAVVLIFQQVTEIGGLWSDSLSREFPR